MIKKNLSVKLYCNIVVENNNKCTFFDIKHICSVVYTNILKEIL